MMKLTKDTRVADILHEYGDTASVIENDLEQSAELFLFLMDRLRQLGPQSAPPKNANISPSQLSLITFAASNPGCGIQSMATALKLAKPTVSIAVGQLEEAGYFIRKTDPQDGRAVQLFLTKKGLVLHQKTHQFRCKKFMRLLTGLAPQERKTLLSLLEKAIQIVENEEGEHK